MPTSAIQPRHLDALKEMGSISAAHAATGISHVLKKRIDITVSDSEVMDLKDVPEMLGGPESLVVAVYFLISGEIAGSIVMLFSKKDAAMLEALLVGGKTDAPLTCNEYADSALKELCNISAGNYLKAFSDLTKMRTLCSVPCLVSDMLGAVLDMMLIELAMDVEQAVLVKTGFKIEEEKISGYFLFIPDPQALMQVLDKLGV